MSVNINRVGIVGGSTFAFPDRPMLGYQFNVANAAGSGAGAAVTTAITFTGELPGTNYMVLVAPNQDATAYVSGKTATGFNVVLTPRLAASTLASGHFDVLVLA